MDQAKADDLIHQIGDMLVGDERYVDRDWTAISVIAIVDGATQVSGYSYDHDDQPIAGTPRNWDIHDRFLALQDATTVEGKSAWKSCLFQIKRSDMKAMVDFEYDDAMRWKVTPANIKTKPIELRPA